MSKEAGKNGDAAQDMIWVGQDRGPAVAAEAQPAPAPSTTQERQSEEQQSRRHEQSRALAETLVTSFTDRLIAEAGKKNGYLTIGDLTKLAGEFKAKTAQLEKLFAQSFEEYGRANERASFDHARKYPFDRIIVDTFAELFESRQVRSDGANAVSRRVLPGFFLALEKMISQDIAEELQEGARGIVNRIYPGEEKDLNWEVIYADAESKDLCLDALMAIAPHFDDIQHRQAWFLPLVNGGLDASDDWQLTERGFYNLVDYLFARLRAALTTYEDRGALVGRHGEDACLEVERAFLHMDQSRPGY